MRGVGLTPSDTGASGGREVRQRVTHYIEAGSGFEKSCASLMQQGFELPYVELWGDRDAKAKKTKAASKTKYTCPECATNAWAKPETKLICGECDAAMEAEPAEEPG